MFVASFPAARHPLSRQAAYFLAAATIGLALFASGTPSPLYGTYSQLWGFDSVVLTLVYATYAFGVLVTLLLAGRLSDEVGRRPVLIVAMATLADRRPIPFMLADSVVWLFVARGIQGLATGLALSAASAALLDLHPNRDPVSVSLANGVASTIGMGSGVIISAAIVQFLPAPRVLPYVLLAILFLGFLVAAWRLQGAGRGRARRPLPPHPAAALRAAGGAPPVRPRALAVLSSWSIGGLFLSLGPELATIVYKLRLPPGHQPRHLPAGDRGRDRAAALRPLGAVARRRRSARSALAAGMGLIVAAAATESAVLFTLGAIVTGAGFGTAFLGGLRSLSSAIPPEHRAATMSAFYLVAYGSLSVPAVHRRLRGRTARGRRRPSRSSAARSSSSPCWSPPRPGASGRARTVRARELSAQPS